MAAQRSIKTAQRRWSKKQRQAAAKTVYPVPGKRQAMGEARHILQTLRQTARGLPPALRTAFVLRTLRRINPFVFEELLLHCCADNGWQVRRNQSYIYDGGVDGIFYWQGHQFLLQAKRYSGDINPAHVAQFADLVTARQACGGAFIHTGTSCPRSQAIEAQSRDILLIEQDSLAVWVLERLPKA